MGPPMPPVSAGGGGYTEPGTVPGISVEMPRPGRGVPMPPQQGGRPGRPAPPQAMPPEGGQDGATDPWTNGLGAGGAPGVQGLPPWMRMGMGQMGRPPWMQQPWMQGGGVQFGRPMPWQQGGGGFGGGPGFGGAPPNFGGGPGFIGGMGMGGGMDYGRDPFQA